MKPKEDPHRRVHSKRGLFLRIGFVISILLVIVAFHWHIPPKEYEPEKKQAEDVHFTVLPTTVVTEMKEELPEPEKPKKKEIQIIEVSNTVESTEKPVIDELEIVLPQIRSTIEPEDVNDIPEGHYRIVEEMPEFPGGEEAMNTFIRQNIRYPHQDRRIGREGYVYVQFIVDENGVVSNIEVLRAASATMEQEAVRVISMMPNWKPGRQQGRNVPVLYMVPIRFAIQ